jgi:hypothetical protein
VINNVEIIAVTDTTIALADSTYGRASVSFNGTTYQMCWNGIMVGVGTTGSAPVSPSIGLEASGSQINCIGITYVPIVTYTDPLTVSGNEARFMQLASTNITLPNTTGTWAVAAGSEVVVGSGIMTTSSTNDEAIACVLRSDNFTSGEFEIPFTNNGDGGGWTDSIGPMICYQDILNHYRICIEDVDGTGTTETLKVYKVVAGTATQLGTSKDVSARYARGTEVVIKVHYNRELGRIWAYLKDNVGGDAGYYPATPDVSDAYAYNFPYGKLGVWAAAATLGSGHLNVAWGPPTARAGILISETNIPVSETGFYFRDEYNDNSFTRYRGDTTFSVAGGRLITATGGSIETCDPSFMVGDGTISCIWKPTTWDGSSRYKTIIMWRDDPTQTGTWSSDTDNRYAFYFSGDTGYLYAYKYQGTVALMTTTVATGVSYTFNADNTLSVTRIGKTFTITINGTPYSWTDTDTTIEIPYGYIGVANRYSVTAEWDNLTFIGTCWHMKPMARGAQEGEYWDGTTIVPCTRVITDYNWNTIADYTGVTSSTVDTFNGRLTLADTTDIYLTGISASVGVYYADILYSGSTAHLMLTIAGNTIEIDHAGAIIFNGGAAESWTVGAPSAILKMRFVATGTQIAVYTNGVIKGTKIGLTLVASSYMMHRITTNFYIYFFGFDAIESISTTGIVGVIGGVPYGARYDIQEEVYYSKLSPVITPERLTAYCKTTTIATDSVELFTQNITDSTSIMLDEVSTIQSITLSTTNYETQILDTLTRINDVGDTVKASIRRKDYNGVAYDNQPVVLVDM